jgi:TolA-binding protein
LNEFANADSAQAVNLLYAEALFGQGEFMRAGAEYSRAAYGRSAAAPTAAPAGTPTDTTSIAQRAGQNAIVAFDSAFVRDSTNRAVQDSLFRAVDNFVRAFPQTDQAKRALIQKGRRASQAQRWDVMAETFRTYASTYPNDPYTPTAQKLIGDALFRGGQYAEAQTQWESAATIAAASGRRALADSITRTRETAAGTFADTLIRQGQYRRAAEEVYVAFADRNPTSDKAPEALRDAIATYVTADSVARGRNDADASRQARERIVELSNRLVAQYPNYRYRLQYQALGARTLADLGRNEESIDALRKLVNDNPTWTGRADAMVTIAQRLDSLNRKAEAAAAYAAFAEAFPRDQRSADAQFNAGVTYLEAGDTTAAARAFGRYADRFPRGARATDARTRRAALLLAAGDTSAANAEFGRMCAQNAAANRDICAAYRARQAFETAVGGFDAYRRIQFTIRNKNQVSTSAALRTVQQPKLQALARLSTRLTDVIKTGVPEYLAGATFYLGLAQWEYGNYLRNIQLPATGWTDEERAAATQGAANLAEQEYARARETWQALLTKAEAEEALRNAPGAQRWLQLARDAVGGNVPSEPPPPATDSEEIQ